MFATLVSLLAFEGMAGTCEAPLVEPILGQDLAVFDQSEDGWRQFARAGCYLTAAALIEAYRLRHANSLTAGQYSRLEWHEGQMYAYVGEYTTAISLFAATYDTARQWPDMELKVDANIAFLSRDRDALQYARDQLAALPVPESFAASMERFRERFPDREPPSWPLNLDILDRLLACFEYSYAIAYEGACDAAVDG